MMTVIGNSIEINVIDQIVHKTTDVPIVVYGDITLPTVANDRKIRVAGADLVHQFKESKIMGTVTVTTITIIIMLEV